jgi:hypothetical protein
MNGFTSFLSGAIMMVCAALSLFFLKFWNKSGERLFGIFSLAFLLMAIERVVLETMDLQDESRPYIYMLRLFAFGLIMAGVIHKNREGSSQTGDPGGSRTGESASVVNIRTRA